MLDREKLRVLTRVTLNGLAGPGSGPRVACCTPLPKKFKDPKSRTSDPNQHVFLIIARDVVVRECENPFKLVRGDKQIACEVKNEEEALMREETVKINDLIDFVIVVFSEKTTVGVFGLGSPEFRSQ